MKTTTSLRLKQILSERNLRQVDILNSSLPLQKELGIKMGKSALSQYVSGKSSPDQDKLVLLSKTLGVSEAWLMGYKNLVFTIDFRCLSIVEFLLIFIQNHFH